MHNSSSHNLCDGPPLEDLPCVRDCSLPLNLSAPEVPSSDAWDRTLSAVVTGDTRSDGHSVTESKRAPFERMIKHDSMKAVLVAAGHVWSRGTLLYDCTEFPGRE